MSVSEQQRSHNGSQLHLVVPSTFHDTSRRTESSGRGSTLPTTTTQPTLSRPTKRMCPQSLTCSSGCGFGSATLSGCRVCSTSPSGCFTRSRRNSPAFPCLCTPTISRTTFLWSWPVLSPIFTCTITGALTWPRQAGI